MNLKAQAVLVALAILGIVPSPATSQQDFRYGLIRVEAPNNQVVQVPDNVSTEFCFTYPGNLFSVPTVPEDKVYKLYNVTDLDMCKEPAPIPQQGQDTLFLMSYKNCSVLGDYVNFTTKSNGIGFFVDSLFKNNSKSYGLKFYGGVRNETIQKLKEYFQGSRSLNVQIFGYEDSFFGTSIVFLWLTACLCVAIGSLTGPYQDLQSTSSRQQILESSSSSSNEPKNVQINFTVTLVVTLVVFITGTLLLLYFFYAYLVYFFMAVFCVASGRATYEILTQIAHLFKFDACMPRIRGCGIHKIFLAAICITLPIMWFLYRREDNIWILQDLLGICFCIHIIQTLRIPNLQICAVLLSLLFIYDVFFVFITPYITSDGKSVMVEVATGGGSNESLPLLIKFPRTLGPAACQQHSYSLLGFGDIIVPGFLVCFAHSFDIIRGDKARPYFIVTLIGYGIGLALAFVALFITQTGQPALLYIVPSTLLAIFATGLCRRQLRDLWRGSITITEVEP